MNSKTLTCSLLIVIGCAVLAYSALTFSTPERTVQFLGQTIRTTDLHYIPPVAGAFCLISGIVLLLRNPKR